MIIKCVEAGDVKCPLQHMIHCMKFVLGLHCPPSCACSGILFVCPSKIFLTSLYRFVSHGVPVLTMLCLPASLPAPSAVATSCSKPLLEHLFTFPLLSVYVTGSTDSKNAHKHVFKARRQVFKTRPTPIFAGHSTCIFRWVRGSRFSKHVLHFFKRCTSGREARFLDETRWGYRCQIQRVPYYRFPRSKCFGLQRLGDK